MKNMNDLFEGIFMTDVKHVPGEISLVRDDFKDARRWADLAKAFGFNDPKAVRHLRLVLSDAYASDELPMDWK